MSMKQVNPLCPRCNGHANRNGLLKIVKEKGQKYFCTQCKSYFSTFTNTIFFEKEFSSNLIALAIELKTQVGLSLRQLQLVLNHFFKKVPSLATLSLWTNQLRNVELPKTQFNNVWHVDEMFIKHQKRLKKGNETWFTYLWVVSDDDQQLIALHHSKKRDVNAAKEAFSKARRAAGFVPRIIVSDHYSVYPKAVRSVLHTALHVKAHFESQAFLWQGEAWCLSNNPAESLNSRLRDRLRRIRGLNKARNFLEGLQLVWNTRFTASLARALLQTVNA